MKTKSELEIERNQLTEQIQKVNAQLDKIEEQEKAEQNSFMKLDTFEKCCAVTGEDPNNPKFHTGDNDTQAYEMLKVITKAINGNKKPTGPYYYTPYFNRDNTPGSGFSLSCCCWPSLVSSRLEFIDSERAEFAGKTFEKIYYRYLM